MWNYVLEGSALNLRFANFSLSSSVGVSFRCIIVLFERSSCWKCWPGLPLSIFRRCCSNSFCNVGSIATTGLACGCTCGTFWGGGAGGLCFKVDVVVLCPVAGIDTGHCDSILLWTLSSVLSSPAEETPLGHCDSILLWTLSSVLSSPVEEIPLTACSGDSCLAYCMEVVSIVELVGVGGLLMITILLLFGLTAWVRPSEYVTKVLGSCTGSSGRVKALDRRCECSLGICMLSCRLTLLGGTLPILFKSFWVLGWLSWTSVMGNDHMLELPPTLDTTDAAGDVRGVMSLDEPPSTSMWSKSKRDLERFEWGFSFLRLLNFGTGVMLCPVPLQVNSEPAMEESEPLRVRRVLLSFLCELWAECLRCLSLSALQCTCGYPSASASLWVALPMSYTDGNRFWLRLIRDCAESITMLHSEMSCWNVRSFSPMASSICCSLWFSSLVLLRVRCKLWAWNSKLRFWSCNTATSSSRSCSSLS